MTAQETTTNGTVMTFQSAGHASVPGLIRKGSDILASIKNFAKDMGFKTLEGWLANDGLQDALAKHKLEKYKQRHENDISEVSTEPKRENLDIAKAVSARSTCLRRQYGAVIVKDDQIVASGYNGAPRGVTNCCDLGTCKRQELSIPPGERYELCRSVHAEANAIISAGFEKTHGATLYLAGRQTGGLLIDAPDCCMMCKRLIINAGISKVIFLNRDESTREINVIDWIEEEP